MNAEEIDAALQDVFDQAIVFHAYTDYMRDYEILTFAVADQRTGIPPAYHRYVFKICVEVEIGTAVSVETWSRSLDDRLLSYEDYEAGTNLNGFVWGVKWQCLYPGGRVVPDSERARRWSAALGIPFHEVSIETNCHDINLVFSDLEVTRVEPGYAPFVVASADH